MTHKKPILHRGASPKIFQYAKQLRKRMTPAEQLLWERLRNKRFDGLKFRRQHPLNYFIADFYCHKHLLVIELDGSIHDSEEAKDYDQARTEVIESFGICVLRFANKEVLDHVEKVLDDIRVCIET